MPDLNLNNPDVVNEFKVKFIQFHKGRTNILSCLGNNGALLTNASGDGISYSGFQYSY